MPGAGGQGAVTLVGRADLQLDPRRLADSPLINGAAHHGSSNHRRLNRACKSPTVCI